MKKNNKIWVLIGGIISEIILIGVYYNYFSLNDNGIVSNSILLITFWGLAWYAFETSGLRREAEKTNINNIKPIFQIYKQKPSSIWEYRLKNVGKGSAFNIQVNSLIDNEEKETYLAEYYNQMACDGDTKSIKILKNEHNLYNVTDFEKEKKDVKILINFIDVNGREYHSFFHSFKPGKPLIFKFQKEGSNNINNFSK
ncbi:MAG: hypothetical protein ABH835_00450 [Patescibacteria group bacterium]